MKQGIKTEMQDIRQGKNDIPFIGECHSLPLLVTFKNNKLALGVDSQGVEQDKTNVRLGHRKSDIHHYL